jgi:hypothetical protein
MIHGWQDQGQDLVSRCPVSKLNNETRRIINSSRTSETLEASDLLHEEWKYARPGISVLY